MQIVIVDDDKNFVKAVEKTLKDFFKNRKETTKIISFESSTLIYNLKKQNNYDIYLLDIEMPVMNGLKLAEKIYALHANARIVFLTSYEKYALSSIKIGAYYYIIKDSYKEELIKLLERICKEEEENKEEYYTILSEMKYCKISVDDILYLTKEKKYTVFHCLEEEKYKERESLQTIYLRLPKERFVFIDKGIIVNMKHIVSLTKLEVTMRCGTVLPVSRRARADVQEKLANYWSEAW